MSENSLNPMSLVGKPCFINSNPPNSFNCWDLAVYIRLMCFDLETPLVIKYDEKFDPKKTVKKLFETGAIAEWEPVYFNYMPGDIALFATKDKNELNHVGVFIKENTVMHATTSIVMCNSIAVLKRVHKALKVYRWPSLTS